DVHYEYSADNGYLEFKIEHGIRTEYGNYDTKGNPGYIIQAAGTVDQRRKDYTYDPRFHNKIATITEPSVFAGSQKVTSYTYDGAGNVTSVTIDGFRPDGTAVSRTSNYQYTGPYQQLSQIDGPRTDVNDIIDFEYYANSVSEGNNRARLRNVRGSDGNTLRSNISYTATGKVASEYRSNSLYMGYAYELDTDRLSGMLEYDFSNAYWRITDWTYLPTGEVKTISQAKNTTEEVTLTLDYDAARRLTRITDGLGNYIEYILDSEGNVEKENIYDVTGYLKKTLTQTFDSYDRLDNFTEQNRVENKDYNTDGTLNNTTDGKGVVTDYSYDNLKRLTQVIQDQGGTDTATANALTQYGYDVQDNLISVTDANSGQTSYIYDDLGNLISQTSPDTGITIFTHDEAGNIATQIDAKGQLFSYSYDAYNRLTTKDEPGSDDDVSYVYDACVNGVGRLCEVVRKNSSLRYQYNVMGDVLNVEQSVVTGSVNNYQSDNVITYSYDGVGRVKTITYPSTAVVTYSYDAAGQVSAVTLDKDGVQTLLTQNVIYSPFGPVASQTVGSYVNLTGFYYDDYRPFNLGDSNFYNEIINNYDLNANPLSIVETGEIQNYLYDAHDRLDTSNGVRGDFNYDYDLVGNKTQIIQDGTTTGITYDLSSNRMNNLAGSTVVIDANGNTTQLRGMLLGFTTDNRLKNVNATAFYEYNGLGQRSMKQVTASGSAATHGYVQSVVYLYGLKGELLAETGPTGKVMKEYVYMNDRPLAMLGYTPDSGEYFLNADLDGDGSVNAEDYNIWKVNYYDVGDPLADVNGDGRVRKSDNNLVVACVDVPGSCQSASYSTSIYYIHTDHLGTPRLMSNEAGIAVWKATATPFGKASVNDDVDADGQSVTLNIRQPGQYYDRETGLYYNYYRYYDPETGRYITSDPIGLDGGINTYAYVGGNPLKYTDPLGLYFPGVPKNESEAKDMYPGSEPLTECTRCKVKAQALCPFTSFGLGRLGFIHGSAIGSAVPGVGTALGGTVGGIAGMVGGFAICDQIKSNACKNECDKDGCEK
ncbi:MAG: RHS domain-containing protein, partial [Gammaproteobacteria bacterium]|nr:RHS domain-containing protein [Gammaproteobacteria bacterium]